LGGSFAATNPVGASIFVGLGIFAAAGGGGGGGGGGGASRVAVSSDSFNTALYWIIPSTIAVVSTANQMMAVTAK